MPFALLITAAIVMTLMQIAMPGRDVYHYGWYNALDAALIVLAARGIRKSLPPQKLMFAGGALIVLAGVASGLLGADTQTIAGAPGSTVTSRDFGAIDFPTDASQIPARRYTMFAVFTAQPHDVVHVQAYDARGNHLTITQPANPGFPFLSPVLLMQHTSRVAGFDVQTDEFVLPAVSRTVKAVLFTPSQIAMLNTRLPAGAPGVLFDVQPGGAIAMVSSGEEKAVGGVRLRADVVNYPQLQAASIPFLPLSGAGVIVLAAGLLRSQSRSRT